MSPYSQSETRELILLAAVMNLILIGLAAWELMPVYNGLAYDSSIYAEITRRFAVSGFHIRLDSYYTQRLFPCALVGGAASLFQIAVTRNYLIDAFRLLDLVSINLTAILLAAILRMNGVTGRARLLSLILCFCNFCILKYSLYLPVLTDCSAICLGTAILYASQKRLPLVIALLGVFGAFTHPLLIFVAGALLIWPDNLTSAGRIPAWHNWIPYLGASVYVSICSWIYITAFDAVANPADPGPAPVNMQLYVLSAGIGAVYLYGVLRLAVLVRLPARIVNGVRSYRLPVVLLAITGIKLFQQGIATGPGPLDAQKYLEHIILGSLTQPAQFLVAHISYLGPVVMLPVILLPAFRQGLARRPTGLLLVLIGSLLLLLNSETRQCSFVLPFLIVPLAVGLQNFSVSPRQIVVTAVVAVLISKLWLPVNVGSPAALKDPGCLNQRFFLNIGPWMRWQTYLAQAIVYVLAGLALYIVYRKPRPAGEGS